MQLPPVLLVALAVLISYFKLTESPQSLIMTKPSTLSIPATAPKIKLHVLMFSFKPAKTLLAIHYSKIYMVQTPPPSPPSLLPPLLHPPLCIMPSATSPMNSYSLHPTGTVSILTMYCTNYVLYFLCTALTLTVFCTAGIHPLTHHVLNFLCMQDYCTHYILHSLTHSLTHSLIH